MKNIQPTAPRARLRSYLAAGYALFIVYASLSPFTGWQEQGLEFSAVLAAPLFQQYTWFDAAANLFAYLPLGLLLGLVLRVRFGSGWSVLLALMGGVLLSGAMEYAQMYLPIRISSSLDLFVNGCGTLLGAVLALNIASSVWFVYHLTSWRRRLFHVGGKMNSGLSLVVLWMFAQINPSLPMLGNVFISKAERVPFVVVQPEPFNWLVSLAVALNLLMLGLLLLTLMRKRRHAVTALLLILCVVALAKFIAATVLLKSWALLLWLNTEAMFGIFAGVLLLTLSIRLTQTGLLWNAVLVSLAYLVVAHWILDSSMSPVTMSLYQWNYGHLLNYNGLSQSLALLFPFLMLNYLWRIRHPEK